MATLKQIEANRLNAQKSTGPRTSQGKAESRMNALKSGIDAASTIIRGEDPQALQALTAEYHDRYQPATPELRALLDTLIHNEWLLRRMRKTEAQFWEREYQRLEKHQDLDDDTSLGLIFDCNTKAFERLQRRIDSIERNYHRALNDLERLCPRHPTPQPDPPPAPQSVATPKHGSPAPDPRSPAPHPIGFVPSAASTLLPQRVLRFLRDSAVNPPSPQIGFVPQPRPEARVVPEPPTTAIRIAASTTSGQSCVFQVG